MFSLTLKSGDTDAGTWPITQTPLVIGREGGCDVMLSDPAVSRRHCQISMDGGVIHLQDLGSRNLVLVNSRHVAHCRLELGDEVRVGHSVFFVTRRGSSAGMVPSELQHCSTVTLAGDESMFLAPVPAENGRVSRGTFEDLHNLLAVSIGMSSITTREGVFAALGDSVGARFGDVDAWILLLSGKKESVFRLRGDREGAAPPANLMRMVLDERMGSLAPGEPDSGGWVMAAPILHGEHRVGALALVAGDGDGDREYGRDDLDFLVALAHISSPFFQAVDRLEELRAENLRLRGVGEGLKGLIGASPPMARLKKTIALVAPSDQTVLVFGETGTGKELVAGLLHGLSQRKDGPLVTVNCAAIPKDLFESELFGYEKGAFTGATAPKAGLMEESVGGTLFLDEIGDLSLDNQARILRAVEMKRFRRIGGNQEIQADFRLVAATNKDLVTEIARGTFREDLYHRLNAIQLAVPPLRNRRSDIPELARHFLSMCPAKGKKAPVFSPEAMEYLVHRHWPGNVRELRNVVSAGAALCLGTTIGADDLRAVCFNPGVGETGLTLAEIEKTHILRVYDVSNGNVVEAARRLGLGKSTLYNRLAEYGIKT